MSRVFVLLSLLEAARGFGRFPIDRPEPRPEEPEPRPEEPVGDPCACLGAPDAVSVAGSQYANLTDIHRYGSECAAWDYEDDTPWKSFCPYDADYCHPDLHWCGMKWCYVSEACPTGHSSDVFEGAPMWYSYDACGNPDCYTGYAWIVEAFPDDSMCPTHTDLCHPDEAPEPPEPPCPEGANDGCVFPWKYYDVSYETCSDIGTGGVGVYDYYWCPTAVDSEGNYVVGSGDYKQCCEK